LPLANQVSAVTGRAVSLLNGEISCVSGHSGEETMKAAVLHGYDEALAGETFVT